MSNVEQFEEVVTAVGAEAMYIRRDPKGAERLIIRTPGGLITREVPLLGDLGRDIQRAMTSAREIVASARSLTAAPARNLSSLQASRVRAGSEILVAGVSRSRSLSPIEL